MSQADWDIDMKCNSCCDLAGIHLQHGGDSGCNQSNQSSEDDRLIVKSAEGVSLLSFRHDRDTVLTASIESVWLTPNLAASISIGRLLCPVEKPSHLAGSRWGASNSNVFAPLAYDDPFLPESGVNPRRDHQHAWKSASNSAVNSE